jgi:hypothetical protein
MLHVKNVLASTDDLVVVPTLFITVSTDLDIDATVHMIKFTKDNSSLTFGRLQASAAV